MPEPQFDVKVTLEAAISPSENPTKVIGALRNVAGGPVGRESSSARSATLVLEDSRGLSHIRDQLRDRHVRSAARRQLLVNRKGAATTMLLNRQAAAAGVVALCGSPEESPLGPILLSVESDTLEAVVDWLTAYAGG